MMRRTIYIKPLFLISFNSAFLFAMMGLVAPHVNASEDKVDEFNFDIDGVIITDINNVSGIYLESNDKFNFDLRRASIEFEAEYTKKISFQLELAYDREGDNNVAVRDAYINFSLPSDIALRFGKMKPRFGLERSSSLKNLSTIDRQMTDNLLILERSTGFTAEKKINDQYLYLAYFNAESENDTSKAINSLLARYVIAKKGKYFNQLGFSYAAQNFDGLNYRVSTDAGISILKPFLKTEKIQSEDVETLGADWTWQFDRLTFRTELINVSINSDLEGDRKYFGITHQTSWLLTSHNLRFKNGRSKGLGKKAGNAIEFVTTFNYLDALDQDDGFKAGSISAGVNYYFNQHIKLMSEVSYLKGKDSDHNRDNGAALQLRLQYTL